MTRAREAKGRKGRPRLALLAVGALWLGSAARPVALPPAPELLAFDSSPIRDGDLVFRRGRSALSRLVLGTDSGAEFSHVGLVWRSGDDIRVLHVAPGELPEIPDVARSEPLASFLAADRASAFAVFRLDPAAGADVSPAVAAARRWASDRVPFDAALDLEEASRLYCTELVWRAYLEAGVDLVDGAGEELSFLGVHRTYISVSQLEASRHLRLVLRSPSLQAVVVRGQTAAPLSSVESEDSDGRSL